MKRKAIEIYSEFKNGQWIEISRTTTIAERKGNGWETTFADYDSNGVERKSTRTRNQRFKLEFPVEEPASLSLACGFSREKSDAVVAGVTTATRREFSEPR